MYNLTFWSNKVYIYLFINICSTIQSFYFKVKFDENTKCITLVFGKKSYINLFIDISSNIQITYCKMKFDEYTKCITLLFGQKKYTFIFSSIFVVQFKVFILRLNLMKILSV